MSEININEAKKLNFEEVKEHLKEASEYEQLYSIALFDILGFSNIVENNNMQVILDLYNKLLDLIKKQSSESGKNYSFAGMAEPVPMTKDWKESIWVGDANGFINVCYASDTFIIYVNYLVNRNPFRLATKKYEPHPLLWGESGQPEYPVFYAKHHIYLSFLHTCMDFFCQSIMAGIPLRGCISTGPAVMNPQKGIYVGSTLVEAAKGETAQNALGLAFGKSFNNSHPVYNDYFIPYRGHIKHGKYAKFLSPMVPDWARYWRETPEYKDYDLTSLINKMNKNEEFSSYYDNAIKFVEFSEKHENWSKEFNRDGICNIIYYYNKAQKWYESVI